MVLVDDDTNETTKVSKYARLLFFDSFHTCKRSRAAVWRRLSNYSKKRIRNSRQPASTVFTIGRRRYQLKKLQLISKLGWTG